MVIVRIQFRVLATFCVFLFPSRSDAALFSLAQEVSPPSATRTTDLQSLEIEVARLGSQVAALSGQLESERAMNHAVLQHVETMLTIYTGAGAAIVGLFGIFGYANLRNYIVRQVKSQVGNTLKNLADERLDRVILRWDDKFEKLFRRLDRLGRSP